MTPPLPYADFHDRVESGFSGCLRSLKGQPGPQNVLGGIRVRVCLVAACSAAEYSLRDAVSRCNVSTLRAPLRGVTGGHLNYHSSSALSLGVQYVEEHPHPASRTERLSLALTVAPFGM